MQRYVAMELLEDEFDDDQRHVDKAGPQIAKLAAEGHMDSDLLWPELGWLMGDGGKNGYRFGYELGKVDAEPGPLASPPTGAEGSRERFLPLRLPAGAV